MIMVWRLGLMQKMAKFQMEEIKVFGGFLVPSLPKKVKAQIRRLKQKYKNKKMPKKIKQKKFKVNLAILGGGDVVFPIIAAGVFLKTFGIILSLFVTFGALAGLSGLFLTMKRKGQGYPAMPYITLGIFVGIIIGILTRQIPL